MSVRRLPIAVSAAIGMVPATAWAQASSSNSDDAVVLTLLGMFVIIALVYAMPTFVAFSRAHPNRWAILVVNLCFGATLIGWLVSLIWAMNAIHRSRSGSNGGESGLNVFVNDERKVRLDPPTSPRREEAGSSQATNDLVEQLTKLVILRKEGAITEVEYDRLRRRILDSIG